MQTIFVVFAAKCSLEYFIDIKNFMGMEGIVSQNVKL